jgi:hypothetical protein
MLMEERMTAENQRPALVDMRPHVTRLKTTPVRHTLTASRPFLDLYNIYVRYQIVNLLKHTEWEEG